jgi:hypothetical protein
VTARAKYLRIPDDKWERYQHYHKNTDPGYKPPWIKLYVKLLDTYPFRDFDPTTKWVYVGLLMLAAESSNRVESGALILSKRLTISPNAARKSVQTLVENGLIETVSAKKSRIGLDSDYTLKYRSKNKEVEKGLTTVPREQGLTALDHINKKLRGAA